MAEQLTLPNLNSSELISRNSLKHPELWPRYVATFNGRSARINNDIHGELEGILEASQEAGDYDYKTSFCIITHHNERIILSYEDIETLAVNCSPLTQKAWPYLSKHR